MKARNFGLKHKFKGEIKMEQRINFAEKGQGAMKALFGLGGYLMKSGETG